MTSASASGRPMPIAVSFLIAEITLMLKLTGVALSQVSFSCASRSTINYCSQTCQNSPSKTASFSIRHFIMHRRWYGCVDRSHDECMGSGYASNFLLTHFPLCLGTFTQRSRNRGAGLNCEAAQMGWYRNVLRWECTRCVIRPPSFLDLFLTHSSYLLINM